MLIVFAPRCRVFPDWDVIQLVSSSQEGASVQATSTLHETGSTIGEDGEVFLLFWKFETNILYFIALSWKFDSNWNFLKIESKKIFRYISLSESKKFGISRVVHRFSASWYILHWIAALAVCFLRYFIYWESYVARATSSVLLRDFYGWTYLHWKAAFSEFRNISIENLQLRLLSLQWNLLYRVGNCLPLWIRKWVFKMRWAHIIQL